MDDGKPTEPKAKWWSRPTPGRSTRTAPQESSPVEDAVPLADASGVRDGAEAEPTRSVAPEAVRQAARPLHEPDQYSTPPYGGPGPWAPAPRAAAGPDTGARHPRTAALRGDERCRDDGGSRAASRPGSRVPAPAATAVAAPAPAALPAAAAPPAPGAAVAPVRPLGCAPAAPDHQLRPPLGPDGGRRRNRRGPVLVGALLLALVAGGIGGGMGAYIERNGGLTQVELPQDERNLGGRAPDSVAGIAASALPSVVTLHVSGSTESGTGTGFVLDARGHILTNNHVVAPAGSSGEITVTFSGGETASAEVVGKDSGYDLAVVKVSGVSGLKPLPLGNSDNVQVGDPVVAIGAPFDLSNTVTSGIISAKDRPITAGGEKGDGSDISYVDALQTDAPINPGNSGGPLVDTDAHVIGINSAIRAADSGSTTEGGQAGSIGLGFAIPINQGKRVAEELINTGKATHPVIGVTLDMKYTGDGAKVGQKGADGKPSVAPDGPGAKAGIQPGDVITEVDGRRVHSGEELIVKIRSHRPGDRLELKLTRGGKDLSMTLTLGSATGT